MKYIITFFCAQYILICPILGEQALAQNTSNKNNPISEYEDCSDTSISIEQSQDALTKEERISLMEKAFFSSLNKFDRCQISVTNTGANADSDGSGISGSSAESDGASGLKGERNANKTSSNSVASREISGAAKETNSTEVPDSGLAVQEKNITSTKEGTPIEAMANGKVPDDIPPGQNDSILEAQIRAAAEVESDPVKKAMLWNEYRRYKGIKVIGVEDNN